MPEREKQPDTDAPPPTGPHRRDQAVLITVAIAMLVCWGVILSGNLSGRGAADDLNYHWVAIMQFAQQWPVPDLGDYASATTPGYHLLLAPLARAGMGHTGIQLVASLWTFSLLGLLSWNLSRTLGRAAAVLMLPLIASMYVIFPGIWLLPDNAGWLLVLGIVLLSLRRTGGWGVWVTSGVLLLGLVWLRQIHIWAAAPIWLCAWLGQESQTPTGLRDLFADPSRRIGRTLIAIGCTVPAFMALIWFLGIWGGLVPPSFQNMHQGPNAATPGFMLTQLCILSIPFAPMLLPRLRAIWALHWRWLLFAGMLGLVLGTVPASSYGYEAGRYGGWWNMLGKVPTLADRSPLFVLGSVVGSIGLVVWMSLATRRDVWVWVGAMVAFTLAQSANHASWQRYHEPMLLMMMLLIIARSPMLDQFRTRALLGAALLALVLGSITAISVLGAEPVRPDTSASATERNSPDSP